MNQDWHWDLCPRCGATGYVSAQVFEMGGTGGSTITGYRIEAKKCRACDGLGRIKVPIGYHLRADEVGTITSASATVTIGPS